MMSLLIAPMNQDLMISRIKRNRLHDDSQRRQLENMGFVEGAKISVISETTGNLIIKVKDCRFGIGKDIAKKIMVEEVKGE